MRPGLVAILERLEPDFDRRSCHGELLEVMQEKETRSMRRTQEVGQSPQVQMVRQGFLKLLLEVMGVLKADQGSACWFESARIYDILPTTFGAGTVGKPALAQRRVVALAQVAQALAGESSDGESSGSAPISLYLSRECIAEVGREEQAILKVLDSAPSVLAWLQVFSTRLDVATGGQLGPRLQGLEELAHRFALQAVWHSQSQSWRPPRAVATGSLALALAGVGLVHLEKVLRAPEGGHAAAAALLGRASVQFKEVPVRQEEPPWAEIVLPALMVAVEAELPVVAAGAAIVAASVAAAAAVCQASGSSAAAAPARLAI